jgi:hypothetical protein
MEMDVVEPLHLTRLAGMFFGYLRNFTLDCFALSLMQPGCAPLNLDTFISEGKALGSGIGNWVLTRSSQ